MRNYLFFPLAPHHITQRGNRRQQTFFNDKDYEIYLDILKEYSQLYKLKIWCYCLMPNHVHLIAVPENTDSLKMGIGEAHRRYTIYVNSRENCAQNGGRTKWCTVPILCNVSKYPIII